jgi:hypothetical protein
LKSSAVDAEPLIVVDRRFEPTPISLSYASLFVFPALSRLLTF